MNFDKVLGNPWVWGVGIVLGVLVMSASSRGAAQGEPTDPYAIPSSGAAFAAANAGALEFATRNAEIAAGVSRDNNAANLTRDLRVIDAVAQSNSVNAAVVTANTESMAGIAKSRIEANTALAIDRSQNQVRSEMTYVAGNVSNFAAQMAADLEREKTAAALKATTQANKINGDNAFWSGVFDFVGNIGKVILPFLF
jgi:hypothetical protein